MHANQIFEQGAGDVPRASKTQVYPQFDKTVLSVGRALDPTDAHCHFICPVPFCSENLDTGQTRLQTGGNKS
jgi:hypothetical protein